MARKRKKRTRSRVTAVPAAVVRYMKRLNPSKMKGQKFARVKRLRGGGISIVPAGATKPKRRRKSTRRRRR